MDKGDETDEGRKFTSQNTMRCVCGGVKLKVIPPAFINGAVPCYS